MSPVKGKKYGSNGKKMSIFVRLKEKKRQKLIAYASDKRELVNSCIVHLRAKTKEIMEDVYRMEDEMRQKQKEAQDIIEKNGRKDDVARLHLEYNGLKEECRYAREAYNGAVNVLSALFGLQSLTNYLWRMEWYKHFKHLPGPELADRIRNENGAFVGVGADINNLREYILNCIQDMFEDAGEFNKIAKQIEEESATRAKLFNFEDATEDDTSWAYDDENKKDASTKETEERVKPVVNQPIKQTWANNV